MIKSHDAAVNELGIPLPLGMGSVKIKSTKNKGDENMKKGILKWLYIVCLTTLVATVSFIIGVMCYIIWW